MKTIILKHAESVEAAAGVLRRTAAENGHANIGLFVNEDCLEVYRTAFSNENNALFGGCSLYIMNELCSGDGNSAEIRRLFQSEFPALVCSCLFIDPDDPKAFDLSIADAGGLDLAFTGIGTNGALAYNEPSVAFDSKSHIQKLSSASISSIAGLLGIVQEKVPDYGVTAGVSTIVNARRTAAAVFGSGMSGAVFSMLYARTDSTVPSAFLQIPSQTELFLDTESAERL